MPDARFVRAVRCSAWTGALTALVACGVLAGPGADAGAQAAHPHRSGPIEPVVGSPAMRSALCGSAHWRRLAEHQTLRAHTQSSTADAVAHLIRTQRDDGSWSLPALPDRGWFDDQCTANALRILLEWYLETGDESVVLPAHRAISLLLRTQGKELADSGKPSRDLGPFALRVGGLWRMAPDPSEWHEPWWSYIGTCWELNDAVTSGNASALAIAYAVFGDERCKQAVLDCARSLLRLQALHKMGLPEHVGPRGEAMYGRPHEIPAWSTRAVAYAIDVYVDAHRVSNDDRWATAARMSADWLNERKLSDIPMSFQDQPPQVLWPALVEMHTLRPVYGTATGQAVYSVDEAVMPYGWWHPYPTAAIARAKDYFLKHAGQW
jgi:hypothetical protein